MHPYHVSLQAHSALLVKFTKSVVAHASKHAPTETCNAPTPPA